MSAALALPRMSVEEFLDWADARDDDTKFELDDGLVFAMAPGRMTHARAKLSATIALRDAIARAGLRCEAFIEGPGIRVDDFTSYLPDAVVECGPPSPANERFVSSPVIVVEVLSPSTAYRDLGRKARNYFRVPSVVHYLIVDADERVATHHRRAPEGGVRVSDHVDGDLHLDPPGLTVTVADLLPAADIA